MIGDTQSEAATALQAAGFVLGRVSQIVDITCDYIGEVKAQSPAAGTLARRAPQSTSASANQVANACDPVPGPS